MAGIAVTEQTARLSVPGDVSERMLAAMVARVEGERMKVKLMVKEEIEKLIRLGAEITGMTYNCISSDSARQCITPRNMRQNYVQDGSELNIKRIHWIFNELPVGTHQDVIMKRLTHQELVCAQIERRMNMKWGPKKEGESVLHKNCIVHMYSRVLNEKRNTITKRGNGNEHDRVPYVRVPRNWKVAKKGKNMFYWKTKDGPEHLVSER